MIETINSIVTKVVDTVKGPLHTWGPKPNTRKAVKAVSSKTATKKSKCKCSRKCKSC
jgi:hypothetical protein